MHRWQLGAVELFRVDSASFPLRTDEAVPEWAVPHLARSTDEPFVAFSAFGIRDGDRRMVVDPWLADDNPRQAPDASERVDALLAELAGVDLAPVDIDLVVNTHIDGAGWNTRPTERGWEPTFPNARYIFPRGELAAVERGEQINGAAELVPVFDAGLLDLIDAVRDPVQISDHVSLHAAPGHNFGHLAVHIDSGDDVAIIAGHLFLNVRQVADLGPGDGDGPEAASTRRRILSLLSARRGLLLSPLFGGEGGGRVEGNDADGFRLVQASSGLAQR